MALLALCACGEAPDPPWLLGETPRVLAFRTEVVEPGPLSYGLLPIPADRVRDEALPGDAVRVSAWVVSADREYETAELDPMWLLCPHDAGCLGSLSREPEPCGDTVPEFEACLISRDAAPEFVMPPLADDVPLLGQRWVRVLMVGHVDDDVTTEDCLDIVAGRDATGWDRCVVGSHGVAQGPAARLYAAALEQGIEVPEGGYVDTEVPVLPHYGPEVVPLTLMPVYRDAPPDVTRTVRAPPGQVTELEPGAVFMFHEWFDPRDEQERTVLDQDGWLSSESFRPTLIVATGTPDLIRYHGDSAKYRLWAPEEPGRYTVHLTLTTPGGGSAWGTFEFEVRAP